jgi:hypothetical protein
METKLLNPFEDMIGQPVPPVEPQALMNWWKQCFTVWQVQGPRVERTRLETITLIYRMQILTTILKGARPDDMAVQTAASIPLTWPDSEYQLRLAKAPLDNAPLGWRVYRHIAPTFARLCARFVAM